MIRCATLASGIFDQRDGRGGGVEWTAAQPKLEPMPYLSMDDDSNSTISDVSSSVQAVAPAIVDAVESLHTSSQPPQIIETQPVELTPKDIYGQRHPIESERLIATKLQDFANVLQSMNAVDKVGVVQAQQKCPKQLTDAFTLMFLRCECFNVEKAVYRFVKYWDKRISVFGEQAFADISLATLKKCSGETRPLELGVITILSRPKSRKTPPRSGTSFVDERDLIYVDAGKLAPTKYSRNEALRCFWALIHTLLMNDEQVQKRGAIYLINVAQFGRNNRDPKLATMCAGTAMGCLPVRLSAVHMCHTTPCHWLFFQCILWFAGERMRQRVLTHAAATCRAATLKSVSAILERDFGIARACLPIDLGGDVIVPALNQHKHC